MKKLFLLLVFFFSCIFANSLSEIRQSQVVRIGVDKDQMPFSRLKDGEFQGFEIDMAKAMAIDIFGGKNGAIKFVPVDFSDGISALEQNKIDIFLNEMTITNERAKYVDFSMPYFSVNIGVLTKKSENIQKLSNLDGKTIITFKDSVAENFFKKRGFNILNCDNAGSCYRMLKNGQGDAFADDNLVVLAFPIIDNSVEVSIKNLGETDFLGMAVQKGNKELLDVINESMIRLSKEGFFKKAFDDTLNPFYKGSAEEKYFLLDDIYRIFG